MTGTLHVPSTQKTGDCHHQITAELCIILALIEKQINAARASYTICLPVYLQLISKTQ